MTEGFGAIGIKLDRIESNHGAKLDRIDGRLDRIDYKLGQIVDLLGQQLTLMRDQAQRADPVYRR